MQIQRLEDAALAVTPASVDVWRERLAVVRLEALLAYQVAQHDQMRRYRVASHSQSGATYTVTWLRDRQAVRCTCLAGQHGRPCKHAALVIDAEGGWPEEPEPTPPAAAVDMPTTEQADRYEFFRLDRVVVASGEHAGREGVVFAIRGREPIPGGRESRALERPQYRVDDPRGQRVLGWYRSPELRPAPERPVRVADADAHALLFGGRR